MASVLSELKQGFAEAKKPMLLCMGPETILAYLPGTHLYVICKSDFT